MAKGRKMLAWVYPVRKKRSYKSKKYKGYKYYYLCDGKRTYKVRHKGSLAGLKKWWSEYRYKKYGLR